MSGHEHEDEHSLEDEQQRAGGTADGDQDADPSLNAPGDAGPSGVDDTDERAGEEQ